MGVEDHVDEALEVGIPLGVGVPEVGEAKIAARIVCNFRSS